MHELLLARPGLAIAAIIALGAASQWVAWRLRVPAILPLLATGFLVGPAFGWLRPSELFPESLFFPVVSLAVGLILFEGGLTLRFSQLGEIRRIVFSLVTVGALVTWLGGAAAAFFVRGLTPQLSLLFGALIIVTGPTVIGPLLRIVRPNARVANVLKWEGIVIDAVGAMVAVLVFEAILLEGREETLATVVLLLGRFLLVGSVVGALGGAALAWLLRRRAVPDYLINVTSVAFVFTTFAVANALSAEAGLLATVVMGVLVANVGVPNIEALLTFKEDLTVLFVSMLFIVLAANIELSAFLSAVSVPSLALLAIVILVLRPLDVFLSSVRSALGWREKEFVAWVGPRGIVAASVTSLFASKLQAAGFAGADELVPLVFIVIVGTVLLASLTAKPLGVRLGVADPDPQGFLLLGAHPVAREIARGLQKAGVNVLLADTNWSNVAAARLDGLPTYFGSLLSDRSDDEVRLGGIGRLLALTSNDEANALTALKYAREFGSNNVYQLAPSRESTRSQLGGERRGRWLGGKDLTFRRLEALFASGATLQATDLTERFDLDDFRRHYGDEALPLFAVGGRGIQVLSEESTVPDAGTTLLALVPDTGTGDATSSQDDGRVAPATATTVVPTPADEGA